MATMTATNQQYYASYPVAQNVSNMANTNGAQAYQQQQQQQQQQYSQHQQQMQPYHGQQHQHVAINNQSLTQLGQTQRTVSASTNSSTAAALYAIEATKSTKGASKERRDKINTQIAQLRELLPLPASTRQRLSQLQLMALVLVYVRKSNYFCNAFGNYGIAREPSLTIPASGFSKALNGFLMMLTQKGKLLYISDNAAEYLGHSMEDLLSHGDEVYDIIEDQDKKTIRTELLSNDDESQSSPSSKSSSLQQSVSPPSSETRIALCRMNVSRNARRQMRFGDQKVVLIEGHYFGYLPLSSRNEPVFLASCTPIAMPETRECVVQGSTNVFTSIHSMDMKFLYIDGIGEHHLNCTRQQIQGMSWYELIHTDHLHEAQQKHKRITANDQERSTIALLRMMNLDQTGFVWVHSVMQVKEATDTTTQPVIVCTNQVLSEREAHVMRSNLWLYQFYSLHSKMHCNYSANSPSAHNNQSADSPNSVCSDSEEPVRCKSESNPGGPATLATINTPAAVASELSKSPPAKPLISGQQRSASLVGESSPTRSQEAFTSQDNYGAGNNGCANGGVSYAGGYQSALHIQPHKATPGNSAATATATPNSKLSPPTQSSPSSLSPLSSSSSYGQQQRYHQLGSSVLTNPLINIKHTTDISINHHHHHHHNSSNSVGSASVSSTSSSSSSSDSATPSALATAGLVANSLTTGSQNVAQTMAAAVTAAGPASLYAAAAAGIDAIDPLQHMHHAHHHHHHPMYPTAATSQHQQSHHLQQPTSHQQHAAAAVNYATHVMAAQRVAHQQSQHHHHHPYHPYQHHQHHHQAVHGHHHQATPTTATTNHNHLAPHHHNHHTTPHALYAPTHHHHASSAAVASTAVFNNAFNHHHQHHATAAAAAAAYHSAATVAAVGAASHPAHHHHHPANTHMQNPYHSANVAAAAAAAHQGVSFHYNKIAAAVNASA